MAEGLRRAAGLRTREAILEAAEHLFLRQGYHATGMRQIAHDAGLSLSAAYNHFTSKEEILQEILAQRNIYGAMAEALSRAKGDTVAQLVQSGFQEIMDALKGKHEFVLLLFMDILEFQGRHASALAAYAIQDILGFFSRLAELGQREGRMREVNPIMMGRAYLGLVFSSFMIENVLRVVAPKDLTLPLRVEGWEQGMVDIFLHGVLKETPRGEVDR